jgi:hypothetical protein
MRGQTPLSLHLRQLSAPITDARPFTAPAKPLERPFSQTNLTHLPHETTSSQWFHAINDFVRLDDTAGLDGKAAANLRRHLDP